MTWFWEHYGLEQFWLCDSGGRYGRWRRALSGSRSLFRSVSTWNSCVRSRLYVSTSKFRRFALRCIVIRYSRSLANGKRYSCKHEQQLYTHTQPFYGPFSGTTRVSRCQKILDFKVQGKTNRGRHTDHLAGRHSIRTNQCPPLPTPPFFSYGTETYGTETVQVTPLKRTQTSSP